MLWIYFLACICTGKSSGFCVWYLQKTSSCSSSRPINKSDLKLSIDELVTAVFNRIDERHAVQRAVIYPCWAILLHQIFSNTHVLPHIPLLTHSIRAEEEMWLWLNRQSAIWKHVGTIATQLRRLRLRNLWASTWGAHCVLEGNNGAKHQCAGFRTAQRVT